MGKDMMDGGMPGDYITPALWFFGRLMNGPSFTISFPPCQLSPHEIKRLLKRNGIKAWTPEILDGQGCITVRKADAGRACQLLQANGVPVNNAPAPQRAKRQAPRRRAAASSPFSVFGSVFGSRCEYCGTLIKANERQCPQCGGPR